MLDAIPNSAKLQALLEKGNTFDIELSEIPKLKQVGGRVALCTGTAPKDVWTFVIMSVWYFSKDVTCS